MQRSSLRVLAGASNNWKRSSQSGRVLGSSARGNRRMPWRGKGWSRRSVQADERATWLAFIPVCLTGCFYLLPSSTQQNLLLQFLPQLAGYGALVVWWKSNTETLAALGLSRGSLNQGVTWGLSTGCVLGVVNSTVILWMVPVLGGDVLFLTETPHARVPPFVMIPWLTVLIAVGVELNFRGFLLGRLERFCCQWIPTSHANGLRLCSIVATLISSLVFALDPFMVMTFRHLHWIALWDGLIWAVLFLRWRNLVTVITAHAVEVMIMYCSVKAALT